MSHKRWKWRKSCQKRQEQVQVMTATTNRVRVQIKCFPVPKMVGGKIQHYSNTVHGPKKGPATHVEEKTTRGGVIGCAHFIAKTLFQVSRPNKKKGLCATKAKKGQQFQRSMYL
eukprot:14660238-Ditylum_brightwellii.AAC.1